MKAIVFDWGDTLMRDFKEYDGPMAEWPNVELMPGVKETLELVSLKYSCYVATNAGASDKDLVIKALKRVGISSYITDVFTSRDLGSEKPSEEFFKAIVKKLDMSPKRIMMVGNDYIRDIESAKKVGMKTIFIRYRDDNKVYENADTIVTSIEQIKNIL